MKKYKVKCQGATAEFSVRWQGVTLGNGTYGPHSRYLIAIVATTGKELYWRNPHITPIFHKGRKPV